MSDTSLKMGERTPSSGTIDRLIGRTGVEWQTAPMSMRKKANNINSFTNLTIVVSLSVLLKKLVSLLC